MEFYSTFVSDVTTQYKQNKAWKFTVKPNLRLPGPGWKVSIAYALLPKMALFPSFQKTGVRLIEMYSKTKKQGQPEEYKKGFFKSTDLQDWEKQGLCSHGIEFFNNVKHCLEETAHSQLSPGYQFTDLHTLEWTKDSHEPELMLKNSVATNTFYIYKEFAQAFQWLNKTTNKEERLGTNLVHSYPNHLRGVSSLDNDKPTLQYPLWLWLSTLSDWRFINLNKSFEQAIHLSPRALQVQARISYDSTTFVQSLGHVHYAPQGRERCWYKPGIETFFEVPFSQWGEVEFTLKELDNTLVQFQSDSQCLIVLHFKKE